MTLKIHRFQRTHLYSVPYQGGIEDRYGAVAACGRYVHHEKDTRPVGSAGVTCRDCLRKEEDQCRPNA